MRLYVVNDRKANTIAFQFAALNDATATRSFEMLLTDPDDNVFNQYPGDYDLYFLGEIKTIDDYSFSPVLVVPGSSYSVDIINSKREVRRSFLNKLKEV